MVSSSSSGATTGKNRGGGGGGGELAVKKGPWTTAEDAILIEYVKKHGEGNWNAVQRNSGLLRCGKSCRLRWANHLRPNLKKGAFSAEEERLIIELHAKHGNKWARMASQLPGRTDNEIKNYWNTRVKRLQRAGLPIYPSDIPQQHDQPQFQPRQQYHPKLTPPLSLFTPFNFQTIANPLQHTTNSSFLSNPNHQFNHFPKNSSIGISTLPLPSSALPSSLFNHTFSSELFLTNPNPLGLVHSVETEELPSIQPPALGTNTADSSGSTGDDYMLKSPSDVDEYCVKPQVANSGLLEALLEESKALVQSENLKKEITLEAGEDNRNKMISVSCTGFTEVHDSSSANSSINGVKANEPLEEMNPIDDDLSSLLNNFPLTVPVPDWYDSSANGSIGSQSSNMNDDNSGLNNLLDASPVETTMETTNQKWTLGSCCWNNMPGIC